MKYIPTLRPSTITVQIERVISGKRVKTTNSKKQKKNNNFREIISENRNESVIRNENLHLPQYLNPIVNPLSINWVPAKHFGNRSTVFVIK